MNKSMAKAVFIAASLASTALVYAQERRIVREHERVRYATPHWVYDDRFHHNRYYPARGYIVETLPPGNISITFRGAPFWFHSGVWYQRNGPRYVVVQPPVGVIVPALPPGYTVVYFGGVPYYYANDVYYVQRPDGYAVVDAPAGTAVPVSAVPPAPQAAAPAASAPAGTWYYCDSARTYYPYVQSCPEGWRPVAATPPR